MTGPVTGEVAVAQGGDVVVSERAGAACYRRRMRHAFVILLFFVFLRVCLTGCGSKDSAHFIDGTGTGDAPKASSNLTDVYFGDPLPTPLVLKGVDSPTGTVNAMLVRVGEAPKFFTPDAFLSAALFPRWDGDLNGSTATFTTPMIVPLTGSFALAQRDAYITDSFTVSARQPAYVQCLDATVLAGAATQDPPPFRAKVGSCTMTRSGGDTKGKTISSATCTTSKGQSTCAYDAGQKACVGTPVALAQRRAPGDAVTLTWQGGDVPAGSVNVVVPSTVDLMPIAGTHPMSEDLIVQFTGGASSAELRMTLTQVIDGSRVAVDCDVAAASGSVTLPKSLFSLLQAGEASLLFTNAGVLRVHADPWEVEASAQGLVRLDGMLIDSVSLQLL